MKYPVRYFTSDTTGEKSYEEFYMPGEKIDMQHFKALSLSKEKNQYGQYLLKVIEEMKGDMNFISFRGY